MNYQGFSQKIILNEKGDTVHVLTNSQVGFLLHHYYKSFEFQETIQQLDSISIIKQEKVDVLNNIINELGEEINNLNTKETIYNNQISILEKDIKGKDRKINNQKNWIRGLTALAVVESMIMVIFK